MENLSNFDTLMYVYLFLTLGTLIYPVQLWFRVNFVNFIFMAIFAASIMLFKYDISLDINTILREDFMSGIYLIVGFVSVWIVGLRMMNNISLIDSLFLGILPYISVFFILLSKLSRDVTINNFLFILVLFIVPYVFVVYKKMLFTIPFSVKSMSDRF